MELLAFVIRYGFVAVLAGAAVLIGRALVVLAREKASTEEASPAEE